MNTVLERTNPAVTDKRLQLAARVRELRDRGLTHREVAEQLGISRSYAATLDTDPDGTKARARKDSYRGTCARCGGATTGSEGPSARPTHCRTCSHALQQENKKWTRDAVIAAIQRFAAEHGRPPRVTDWVRARDGYPSRNSCFSSSASPNAPFASWADVIEAAGFPRPRVGKRVGDIDWSRDRIIAELRLAADGPLAPPIKVVGHPVLEAAIRYFGSWKAAVEEAGLVHVPHRSARERLRLQHDPRTARMPAPVRAEAVSPDKEKVSSVA